MLEPNACGAALNQFNSLRIYGVGRYHSKSNFLSICHATIIKWYVCKIPFMFDLLNWRRETKIVEMVTNGRKDVGREVLQEDIVAAQVRKHNTEVIGAPIDKIRSIGIGFPLSSSKKAGEIRVGDAKEVLFRSLEALPC